jgi:hypothetical protein
MGEREWPRIPLRDRKRWECRWLPFGYPLRAVNSDGTSNNKILWYVRLPRDSHPLHIQAHPLAHQAPLVQSDHPSTAHLSSTCRHRAAGTSRCCGGRTRTQSTCDISQRCTDATGLPDIRRRSAGFSYRVRPHQVGGRVATTCGYLPVTIGRRRHPSNDRRQAQPACHWYPGARLDQISGLGMGFPQGLRPRIPGHGRGHWLESSPSRSSAARIWLSHSVPSRRPFGSWSPKSQRHVVIIASTRIRHSRSTS